MVKEEELLYADELAQDAEDPVVRMSFVPLQFVVHTMKWGGADVEVDAIRAKSREEGMRTLRESAVDKLLKGVTTYEEVLRVTWEQH